MTSLARRLVARLLEPRVGPLVGSLVGPLVSPLVGPLADPLVVQPLSCPVPADDAAYRRRKGDLRLAVRSVRQRLQFAAGGQGPRRRDRIDPAWRRALWIHEEAPQIGDALMDLAPRSLLAEHGVAVDLLAPPHLAALFDGDRWLGRAIADPAAVDPARYDFAICSSDARRALGTKRRVAPALPWVSLAGRYGVPDYQRARFVARRLADLLGQHPDDAALDPHARQKLELARAPADPAPFERSAPDLASACVAIACGGVRGPRTYGRWPEVAARLAGRGVGAIVLLGSANGRPTADAVRAARPAGVALHDRVDRLDLHATRAAIERCDLLLCADGGLMHLGLTTPVPIVALFTSTIDPAWRLPRDFDGVALRSPSPEVDAVAPEQVVAAAFAALRSRPD